MATKRSVKDELAIQRIRTLLNDFPFSGTAGIEGTEVNTLDDIADNLERLSGTIKAHTLQNNQKVAELAAVKNDLAAFGRVLARIKAYVPLTSTAQQGVR